MSHLGHVVFPPGSFGSQEIGGYLFIHQTYQCLQQLTLPEPPYLFALLLQKWEMPWARAFPLRLMLRLGAEFRCMSCIKFCLSTYFSILHFIITLFLRFLRQFFVTGHHPSLKCLHCVTHRRQKWKIVFVIKGQACWTIQIC